MRFTTVCPHFITLWETAMGYYENRYSSGAWACNRMVIKLSVLLWIGICAQIVHCDCLWTSLSSPFLLKAAWSCRVAQASNLLQFAKAGVQFVNCTCGRLLKEIRGRLFFFFFHHFLDWEQVTKRREEQQVEKRKSKQIFKSYSENNAGVKWSVCRGQEMWIQGLGFDYRKGDPAEDTQVSR